MVFSRGCHHHLTRRFIVLFLALFLLSSCGTYKDRVAPIDLPEPGRGVEVAGGLKLAAIAFDQPQEAEKVFGFRAIEAGLLPVQVTFLNDSPHRVWVNGEQTFLIDRNNKAWPILSLKKSYLRAKGYVDVGETIKGTGKSSLLLGAAGAVVGLAVGIVSGNDIGESVGKGAVLGAASGALIGGTGAYVETGKRIKEDLQEKSLTNEEILPNQIAYGVFFFPGFPGDEAQGAVQLRLSLRVGKETFIVPLDLDK